MFLGLPDPDPLVRGMDPDPDPALKIAGTGSISQRHGSADPDPDPPQNVLDPQHCLEDCLFHIILVFFLPDQNLTVL